MIPQKIEIPLKALLAVYLVVPLFVIVVGIDQLFLGGHIKLVLPQTPNNLFLYGLVFVIPHIIASFFSFGEREYVAFYKKRLMYEIPFIALFFLLIYLYAFNAAFLAYVVYTQYHQIAQQFGIGRFYFRTKLPEYSAWRLLAVLLATIGYSLVYRNVPFLSGSLLPLLVPAGILLAVPFTLLSWRMFRRISTRSGKQYFMVLWGTYLAEFFMLFMGYPLFVIFCTRVEHDIPAFMAYVMHDHNRKHDGGKNVLYRLLQITKIPLLIFSPVFAIAIAFVVVRLPYIAGALVFLVGMLHYYIEGFIWKNGSIHRRYIHFVD